jgi:hypothetical protein
MKLMLTFVMMVVALSSSTLFIVLGKPLLSIYIIMLFISFMLMMIVHSLSVGEES